MNGREVLCMCVGGWGEERRGGAGGRIKNAAVGSRPGIHSN